MKKLDLDVDMMTLTFLERSRPEEFEVMRWVLKCWNKGAQGLGMNRHVTEDVYWKRHNDFALYLAQRGFVTVATLKDAPTLFVGFVAGDKGGVHFAYVKPAYRKENVFTRLLQSAPKHDRVFTTYPDRTAWLNAKMLSYSYRHDPYILTEIRGSQ